MKGFRFSSWCFVAHTVLFNRVMNQFEAAQVGNMQQLRVALTVDNVNDADYDGGWTALHWAAYAYNGHEECVKFCIEMGANVNARNENGWTPLHLASWQGNVNVVRVLLDAGAMVDVRENSGRTPLCDVIRSELVNVTKLLVDRGAMVSNVKLDERVPEIPDWVNSFIVSRSNCRCTTIVIIGMHKYRRTTVTGNNDINVLRLISKHIWSTRMDDVWVTPPIETKKLRNAANN
jgi:ankyrin repeat protein